MDLYQNVHQGRILLYLLLIATAWPHAVLLKVREMCEKIIYLNQR